MRIKWVNYTPVHYEILKHIGAVVTEFRLFNWIRNNKKNIAILLRLHYEHTYCINYIKFFIGVNFRDDLHLHVSRC